MSLPFVYRRDFQAQKAEMEFVWKGRRGIGLPTIHILREQIGNAWARNVENSARKIKAISLSLDLAAICCNFSLCSLFLSLLLASYQYLLHTLRARFSSDPRARASTTLLIANSKLAAKSISCWLEDWMNEKSDKRLYLYSIFSILEEPSIVIC